MGSSPHPSGIRLGIARGITYGLFGPPTDFVESMRDLGAGLVRVYVYWNQVEPQPGHFDWRVVDAFSNQLRGDEEVWVTVCSSSLWATQQSTDFLPPSPARDNEQYHQFVQALVARCRGRVRYWQCNNEPSNVGLLWAGTAADYVAQLEVFHRAVRAADPDAAVVLGGCGYDVLSSEPHGPAREFFDEVLRGGRDAFDLFAVHLYDDPTAIPARVETVREMMRSHGYERPVVVGEYNGPTLFQFPQHDAVLQQTMFAAFTGDEIGAQSTSALAANASLETPERRAMKALYAAMPELPPSLQMFMAGCDPALAARRDRINCREIVTRNLLALSCGVHRTVCWLLAPEVANYEDPFTMMELMHGKLPLLAYEGEQLGRPHPAALTFRRLAGLLEGATSVTRVVRADRPGLFAFTIERAGSAPLIVLWKDGDVFAGEDEPPTEVQWPWVFDAAYAIDAFGAERAVDLRAHQLQIEVSVTPVFVSPEPFATRLREVAPPPS